MRQNVVILPTVRPKTLFLEPLRRDNCRRRHIYLVCANCNIMEMIIYFVGEDLVLAAPLDKEGLEGVDSILIDVVCQRQRSTDPSFNIPVHVRVTDVNDNGPIFAGAPYNLSLSELTVVGSKILTITSTGE